jgi:hypothetical protein
MPIPVVCPQCKGAYEVREVFAGRPFPCLTCGRNLVAEDPDGLSAWRPPSARRASASRLARASTSEEPSWFSQNREFVLWSTGIVAATCFIFFVGIAYNPWERETPRTSADEWAAFRRAQANLNGTGIEVPPGSLRPPTAEELEQFQNDPEAFMAWLRETNPDFAQAERNAGGRFSSSTRDNATPFFPDDSDDSEVEAPAAQTTWTEPPPAPPDLEVPDDGVHRSTVIVTYDDLLGDYNQVRTRLEEELRLWPGFLSWTVRRSPPRIELNFNTPRPPDLSPLLEWAGFRGMVTHVDRIDADQN